MFFKIAEGTTEKASLSGMSEIAIREKKNRTEWDEKWY